MLYKGSILTRLRKLICTVCYEEKFGVFLRPRRFVCDSCATTTKAELEYCEYCAGALSDIRNTFLTTVWLCGVHHSEWRAYHG